MQRFRARPYAARLAALPRPREMGIPWIESFTRRTMELSHAIYRALCQRGTSSARAGAYSIYASRGNSAPAPISNDVRERGRLLNGRCQLYTTRHYGRHRPTVKRNGGIVRYYFPRALCFLSCIPSLMYMGGETLLAAENLRSLSHIHRINARAHCSAGDNTLL